MCKDIAKREREGEDMSAYVKPIQATPTLTGNDARNIIRQVLAAPSSESVAKNKKMLEMRKSIEKK